MGTLQEKLETARLALEAYSSISNYKSLSPNEAKLLLYLTEHNLDSQDPECHLEKITTKAISQNTKIYRAVLSRVLNSLEDKAYIKRVLGTRDIRSPCILITSQGRQEILNFLDYLPKLK